MNFKSIILAFLLLSPVLGFSKPIHSLTSNLTKKAPAYSSDDIAEIQKSILNEINQNHFQCDFTFGKEQRLAKGVGLEAIKSLLIHHTADQLEYETVNDEIFIEFRFTDLDPLRIFYLKVQLTSNLKNIVKFVTNWDDVVTETKNSGTLLNPIYETSTQLIRSTDQINCEMQK